MTPSSHHSRSLRGFSLFEMVVVLALLSSLFAVALPAIFRPMAKNQLSQAARQLQSAMLDARARAVESGVPQKLRFEPSGRRYEIVARQDEEEQAESSDSSDMNGLSGLTQGNAPSDPSTAAALQPVQDELPDGVFFAEPDRNALFEESLEAVATTAAMEEEADDAAGENWSAPIWFYPNGRSQNTQLKICDSKSWCIDILLRGLLGTALVGEPRSDGTDSTVDAIISNP
jgi:prepilin-type N-terminal cleavage/methylation domain-containing protein